MQHWMRKCIFPSRIASKYQVARSSQHSLQSLSQTLTLVDWVSTSSIFLRQFGIRNWRQVPTHMSGAASLILTYFFLTRTAFHSSEAVTKLSLRSSCCSKRISWLWWMRKAIILLVSRLWIKPTTLRYITSRWWDGSKRIVRWYIVRGLDTFVC